MHDAVLHWWSSPSHNKWEGGKNIRYVNIALQLGISYIQYGFIIGYIERWLGTSYIDIALYLGTSYFDIALHFGTSYIDIALHLGTSNIDIALHFIHLTLI